MKTVLFINTARLYETVTGTNIQKMMIDLFPLILVFRILCKPEISEEQICCVSVYFTH